METLHAPWRIEYILAPKPALAESLFTRIAQSNDDEANYVIARERTCYALLNSYPYACGHLMVVPYKQAADFNGLTDEEMTDLMKLTRRCRSICRSRVLGKARLCWLRAFRQVQAFRQVTPRLAGNGEFRVPKSMI